MTRRAMMSDRRHPLCEAERIRRYGHLVSPDPARLSLLSRLVRALIHG